MNIIRFPDKMDWPDLIKRPLKDSDSLDGIVDDIINDIKNNGDEAIRKYEKKFDLVDLDDLEVNDSEFDEAEHLADEKLKKAIIHAHQNVYKFHEAQILNPVIVETDEGVECWQKTLPIQKVGLYIPGGTAPLFSTVIMLATPAKIAGCEEIVLCTPPQNNGKINPAVLYAAKVAGVRRVFKIGGVQAIAAMAYGTESVPKVFKIFGPGNQFVMAAKQAVAKHDVAIDMPAGPSEVAIIADANANPEFVAADLLSQAEHGKDSQVFLVSDSESLINTVVQHTEIQLQKLPRKDIAQIALKNSKAVLVTNMDEAMDIINEYAPEHLILAVDKPYSLADKVINAGSVFLGKYSCESAGDYASGTNHTLPTNGYAKMYSGVSLDSFMKKITFQNLKKNGIANIAETVEIMAHNEKLFAHENAMKLRRESL